VCDKTHSARLISKDTLHFKHGKYVTGSYNPNSANYLILR